MKTKLLLGGFAALAIILGEVWLSAAPQAPEQDESMPAQVRQATPAHSSSIAATSITSKVGTSITTTDDSAAANTPLVTTIPSPSSTVGLLTSDPTELYLNTASNVTFTAEIAAPNIISGSINLQQMDAAGNPSILTLMSPNLSNPALYSITLALTPTTTAPLLYRASFAVKGSLLRDFTPTLTVPVTSLSTSTWLTYTDRLGYSVHYPPSWNISDSQDGTDVSLDPNSASSVAGPATEALPEFRLEYDLNPTGLSANQFYNGVLGPDLYSNTGQITPTVVAGKLAITFSNPGTSDYALVIVIPLANAFIAIYDNAPAQVSQALLQSLNIR